MYEYRACCRLRHYVWMYPFAAAPVAVSFPIRPECFKPQHIFDIIRYTTTTVCPALATDYMFKRRAPFWLRDLGPQQRHNPGAGGGVARMLR